MAILFRILFTLGLLILHVSVLSAQPPQVNSNASGGSPLTFVSANPPYILSTFRSPPTYLNCHVAVKIDETWKKHLSKALKFYREKLEEPDDDERDDDDSEDTPIKISDDIVKKMYQLQSQQQLNKSIKIDHEILSSPPKVRNGKRRIKRDTRDSLVYEWYRDGEKVISMKNDENPIINPIGFTLFANGTLKFQASNSTAGEFRCKAKFVDKSEKFVIGPIISTATVVEAAHLINDSNDKKNLTVFEGESVVINCPISSVPEGNYSWNINNNELNFDIGSRSKDSRHFLLSNGSLLIVNSQTTDTGKYRCNATNQFVKKIFRSSFSVFNVVARSAKDDNHESRLLPHLQNATQRIKSGQILLLHCASGAKKISWTFTPRTSNIPISLLEFNNELKYVNVSVARHDGIYNCSTKSDFQLFEVSIVTPPVFLEPQNSMMTSVPATIKFNCSVSGNPPPKVEWYKNGERVPNNHVKHFEYPIIKIETIDPEDEGLYQCLARNEFGEASNTFYLHIRPQGLLNNPPQNPKCYPMDNGIIHVTFDREEQSNKIHYFIASDSPREFYSQLSQDITDTFSSKLSFKINTVSASAIIKPLKPFFLYMRNMAYTTSEREQRLMVSTLSKPIQCATQGIEPKFVKAPGGIFLRWDVPETDVPVTGFTIQFLNNGSSTLVQFTDEVIGTYENWPTFVSWNDIDMKLEKIKVRNTNKSEWTEVQVPGNVTGLYVINTDEINVKILGSTLEDGELFDQDLRYLNWTNIKSSSISLEQLTVGDIESRSAEVTWTGLDSVQCAFICTHLKQSFLRDASEKFKCEKINSLSAKSFDLRNLQPISNYDVFIRDCSKVVISTAENFQTKRDVPSAVTQSHIVTDNGIVLHWKPPINTNGNISHYLVEWTYKNVSYERNITGLSFKFPNTTNTDRFNITVRASGVAGLGYPLIINPSKWGILPFNVIGPAEPHSTTVYLDSFMIFAIILISLMLLVLVVGYILLKRHRYCKNSNGIINSEQSSFPPPTCPLAENIRTNEMYEMQTLIPTTQAVSSNGTEALKKPENAQNGGINENQKILRTSTPTDESAEQLCIELPPITCEKILALQAENAKAIGYLETGFSPKPPSINEQKDMKNGSAKANGNLSPFKCFQASGNDRNSSSGSSSFDSHRQLIDTNLFNGLNNNTVNDSSRIGKSSSIETDNEEDSEENMHEYDLNDSNLSSKPLHPMSWNFRRPLVGPNG